MKHKALWLALALLAPVAARADAVTDWTVEADGLGHGAANWRSLAIMHMAMHDAANAIVPTYRRWAPRAPDEPRAAGAGMEAAVSAAAAEVLMRAHPLWKIEIGDFLAGTLALLPEKGRDQGVALGRAIGAATFKRRDDDGFEDIHTFKSTEGAGNWQATPPSFVSGLTSSVLPFLFPSRDDPPGQPPPAVGSPQALRDIAETRAIGGETSAVRTPAQTDAARFWAFQSSQRGFVLLAVALLDQEPRKRGLVDEARLMSQFTAAMADSAVLMWAEKERYLSWRPVTAIRAGGPGWRPDPKWAPLLETPEHPEYPSGHAADCYVGAGFLDAALHPAGPITYVSQTSLPGTPSRPLASVGQHEQPGGLTPVPRAFPSLAAAAAECLESRIWAGAHFRSAEDESRRVAGLIVRAALDALPRR